MKPNYILELKGISKTFPGVHALDNITTGFERGLTHALMGENGAGKSTLIKSISGALIPDEGDILVDNEIIKHMNPHKAQNLGIGVIYQEFNLVPSLSIAENVFLGNMHGNDLVIDRAEVERKTIEIFKEMEVDINPKTLVKNLSVAYMQLVEIAKALSKNVKVLVMDEPTAPLTTNEVEILFGIIEKLKKKGVTIIYISHRITEVFRIADKITVMRDGKIVGVTETSEIDRDGLIRAMVGREVSDTYPKRDFATGEVILDIQGLSGGFVKDVNFQVHKGEILGLAGLVGAGRTESMRMVFGADPIDEGKIFLHGKQIQPKSPKKAVELGIGFIPEDRKLQGAFLGLPIRWNMTMAVLKDISKAMVLKKSKEHKMVSSLIQSVKVKTPSEMQLVKNLSGGNQQKVIIAKWLAAQSHVMIFDEPTRGIDVGARHEIYLLMNDLCRQGVSIVMISSDMEELLGMSDRIVVMSEGQQMKILEKNEFSQETVLHYASGIK